MGLWEAFLNWLRRVSRSYRSPSPRSALSMVFERLLERDFHIRPDCPSPSSSTTSIARPSPPLPPTASLTARTAASSGGASRSERQTGQVVWVGGEPEVDTGRIKGVAADGKQPDDVPSGEVRQAHRAFRPALPLLHPPHSRVRQRRERRDDRQVQSSRRFTPGLPATSQPSAPIATTVSLAADELGRGIVKEVAEEEDREKAEEDEEEDEHGEEHRDGARRRSAVEGLRQRLVGARWLHYRILWIPAGRGSLRMWICCAKTLSDFGWSGVLLFTPVKVGWPDPSPQPI